MFPKIAKIIPVVSRIITNQYHVPKSPEIIDSTSRFPLCIDCRFYLPMEHSPFYPNSACKFSKPTKTCIAVRSSYNPKDCGADGLHFLPRVVLDSEIFKTKPKSNT
jgi:hypothetical protein